MTCIKIKFELIVGLFLIFRKLDLFSCLRKLENKKLTNAFLLKIMLFNILCIFIKSSALGLSVHIFKCFHFVGSDHDPRV